MLGPEGAVDGPVCCVKLHVPQFQTPAAWQACALLNALQCCQEAQLCTMCEGAGAASLAASGGSCWLSPALLSRAACCAGAAAAAGCSAQAAVTPQVSHTRCTAGELVSTWRLLLWSTALLCGQHCSLPHPGTVPASAVWGRSEPPCRLSLQAFLATQPSRRAGMHAGARDAVLCKLNRGRSAKAAGTPGGFTLLNRANGQAAWLVRPPGGAVHISAGHAVKG